eukprot:scaffold10193_cov107-Isochrysis_galbana.AAC.11
MCISSPPTGPLHYAVTEQYAKDYIMLYPSGIDVPSPAEGQPPVHFAVSYVDRAFCYREASSPVSLSGNPLRAKVACSTPSFALFYFWHPPPRVQDPCAAQGPKDPAQDRRVLRKILRNIDPSPDTSAAALLMLLTVDVSVFSVVTVFVSVLSVVWLALVLTVVVSVVRAVLSALFVFKFATSLAIVKTQHVGDALDTVDGRSDVVDYVDDCLFYFLRCLRGGLGTREEETTACTGLVVNVARASCFLPFFLATYLGPPRGHLPVRAREHEAAPATCHLDLDQSDARTRSGLEPGRRKKEAGGARQGAGCCTAV